MWIVLVTLCPIGTSPKSRVLGVTDQPEQLPNSGGVTMAWQVTWAQGEFPVEIAQLSCGVVTRGWMAMRKVLEAPGARS